MNRVAVIVLGIFGVFVVSLSAIGLAEAQQKRQMVKEEHPVLAPLPDNNAPAPVEAAALPASDLGPNPAPSTGASLCFWLFGLLTVGGAIAMITRRNLVTAVMCLVGTFIALAGLYALLYAHFLAVIQILVYAGAIMVLFVFVVMILNKEEEEPWALRGLIGKFLAGASMLYLLVRTTAVLFHASSTIAEPAQMSRSFGTTQAMAKTLFSNDLFPFEAVSIVLLIAVVGALVLAHPGHANVGEETEEHLR